MKKISLFIMSIFAMGITLAQSVDDFSFIPPTTDNNMTIVFPGPSLAAFEGGLLQAYIDGSPVSQATTILDVNFQPLVINIVKPAMTKVLINTHCAT